MNTSLVPSRLPPEVNNMTEQDTSKPSKTKSSKAKATSHKHARAADMTMETAETSKPKIDADKIGQVGTSVKDGIVSSL
jgi:hypothetical protein